MHSAWLASGNIRSPVRSEGTTEDTTLAGGGDNFLCALQVLPHPQRPVTRARDGARALDDQLLLHGKARPLCGQDARGMHLTTFEIYKRLASDSDDTAGDKVSVIRRTA